MLKKDTPKSSNYSRNYEQKPEVKERKALYRATHKEQQKRYEAARSKRTWVSRKRIETRKRIHLNRDSSQETLLKQINYLKALVSENK